MPAKRTRSNGAGSIFPYRNGFAAYVWVDKPDGKRARRYVYGQTRDIVGSRPVAWCNNRRPPVILVRV
jgi:hypothetical protein